MKTDTELKMETINILINHLGLVETEKFISILQKEPFDYTKWQRGLWKDKTVKELSKEAMEFMAQNQRL